MKAVNSLRASRERLRGLFKVLGNVFMLELSGGFTNLPFIIACFITNTNHYTFFVY